MENTFQSAICRVHTFKYLLVLKDRNWQASSSVNDNILSPEDSMVCVAYRISLVVWWRFIFDPLIRRKQEKTYIEDTIMQSQTRSEMFTIIHEYHTLLRKARLKAAPDETFFFPKKLKFLGHVHLTR